MRAPLRLCCAALALLAASRGVTAPDPVFQKGMHFLGKSFEGTYAYDSPLALESLKNMAGAGVTHVSFTFCYYVSVSSLPAPPPALAPPPAPPCALGGRIANYSNTRPWSGGNGNPHGHENNAHVQFIGKTATADECEEACKSSQSKNCTSWIWHAHDGSDWDGHCYKRSDGQWMPVQTTNDVSGRVNDTVFPPPPVPTPHHGSLRYSTKVSYVEGGAPSGVIYANSSSPSDAELTTIIAAAHALNLTVKLRPTIDPRWETLPGCAMACAGNGCCPGRGGIHVRHCLLTFPVPCLPECLTFLARFPCPFVRLLTFGEHGVGQHGRDRLVDLVQKRGGEKGEREMTEMIEMIEMIMNR
jgi:hypothetical protein